MTVGRKEGGGEKGERGEEGSEDKKVAMWNF